MATDGTPNAGSALYGACKRWAKRNGKPIITYTLESESGASLRGAGWTLVGKTRKRKGGWASKGRPREAGPCDGLVKLRWVG